MSTTYGSTMVPQIVLLLTRIVPEDAFRSYRGGERVQPLSSTIASTGTEAVASRVGEDQLGSGQNRQDVQVGARVRIVEKQNQRTGITTEGIVKELLTNSPFHPHGIKVRLLTGQVGRVKEILPR